MSRLFTGNTADRIQMGPGALSGTTFFGTAAAVFNLTAVAGGGVSMGVMSGGGTSDRVGLQLNGTTAALQARVGNGLVTAPTIVAATADGWVLMAWTKPTGTSTVRFHKYVFATNTWTHEDGATVADSAAQIGGPIFGGIGGGSPLTGEIAAGALWRGNVLTDSQIESLVESFMAWWAIPPTAFWILDQAATAQQISDLTGGGAQQSAGTSSGPGVLSCPLGYGHPVLGA
jgi:hypothetical protein